MSGGPGKGVNLQFNAVGYNQILNNSIHDNGGNGVSSYIHTGSTNDASRTIVQGNTVYSNAGDGVHIRANYWTVQSNIVHDNGGAGTYVGIHSYSGAVGEGTGDNNIIRYNIVYNQRGNGEDGAGIGVDQWCDSNQVYYNVIYANDGGGLYCYNGASCTVYNNTSYGNAQDRYAAGRVKFFQAFVKNIAMHIAAANPQYILREEIPEEVLERERAIYRTQALEAGKPQKVIDKIIEGKIERFYSEVCLLEQTYVKDADLTIKELLDAIIGKIGENISIRRFARFQLGEGLSSQSTPTCSGSVK